MGSRVGCQLISGLLVCAVLSACSSTGGSSISSVSGVTATTQPVIHLQSTPNQVALGGGTSVIWNTENADSCVASGGWSGTKPVSGSSTIETLTTSTTFMLSCQGPGGSASQSAEVTVLPPAPTVSLAAQSTTMSAGMTTVLNWQAPGASNCAASGGWSGNLPTSGSQTTAPLTATTEFTLTCTGPGGASTQSTTVTVAAPAPSITIGATPSSVTEGETAKVTWTTSNATACTGLGAWSGTEPLSGSLTTAGLTATTIYTLSCTGPGGSATQSAVISVTPAAPTVSFGASPSTISKGTAATLNWSSTHATSCIASGSWTGTKSLAGSQSTGSLQSSATYSLKCTGTGGTATQSTTVAVTASAVAPSVTLSAGPSAVKSGGSSTLTWSATNATSCAASGAWSGSKPVSGSQSTGALTSNASYTLTCTGSGGTAAQTATVSVTAPTPTLSFSANPSTVTSGNSATLTWTAANATSCSASGPWTGSKAVSGSQSTGALNASATYSLTCTGAGGVATQTATVSVTDPAPVVTISANPTTLKSGSTSTLTWSSTHATSCTASGGWGGTEPVSGSITTVALSTTTKFTLTCTGSGGSASQSTTVTVAATPPTVSLSASPQSVASGGTSMLTWNSSAATACTASGGWSGSLATSGSKSTAAITATTTYTLACTGSGGTATQSATVTVTAPPTTGSASLYWSPPTANTNGTPLTPLSGYTIFYGNSATALNQTVVITDPNALSYQFTGLGSGTWYFAVAANAVDGTQSAQSALGSKTI